MRSNKQSCSRLIEAFIYLCAFGTLPSECGPATAVEFHIIKVPEGSCGRDAQAMIAAPIWSREDGEEYVVKIVCQRSFGDGK